MSHETKCGAEIREYEAHPPRERIEADALWVTKLIATREPHGLSILQRHDKVGRGIAGPGHDEFNFYTFAIGTDPTAARAFQFDDVSKTWRCDPHTIPSVRQHHAFDDDSNWVSKKHIHF
jgi:hypothetical protein